MLLGVVGLSNCRIIRIVEFPSLYFVEVSKPQKPEYDEIQDANRNMIEIPMINVSSKYFSICTKNLLDNIDSVQPDDALPDLSDRNDETETQFHSGGTSSTFGEYSSLRCELFLRSDQSLLPSRSCLLFCAEESMMMMTSERVCLLCVSVFSVGSYRIRTTRVYVGRGLGWRREGLRGVRGIVRWGARSSGGARPRCTLVMRGVSCAPCLVSEGCTVWLVARMRLSHAILTQSAQASIARSWLVDCVIS